MHAEPEPAVLHAIDGIQAYLALHPAAADSEQGIAEWWLPAVGTQASAAQVRRALDVLVQRGLVDRTLIPGAQAIYGKGKGIAMDGKQQQHQAPGG